MSKLLKTFALAAMLMLFSLACQETQPKKTPKDVIPPQKMEKLLFDMHRIDAMYTMRVPESRKYEANKLYASLFDKYEITRESLDRSLQYYADHAGQFGSIYDNVLKRLSERKEETQKAPQK